MAIYKYQDHPRYFAQVAGGLEKAGAEELERLGAREIAPAFRGLYFDADPATLYRINYESRLLTRVLAPLTSFTCHNPDYLYRTLLEVNWSDFMNVDDTFAVFANVSNSKIRHSKYAALRVKDAIADYFRERTGRRPDVDTIDPTVWFNLHIENNHATLSLDTSGGSLHRRGYRTESTSAPMQETVAAAIIRMTEWDGETPLHDPMCGSGTLLAEALMHVCRIPAGYLRRRFGFEALPDFDRQTWTKVKEDADARIRALPDGLISGSDIDPEAVSAARRNLANLPSGRNVRVKQADLFELDGLTDTTIVMNPPYGRRMSDQPAAKELMTSIGDFLKQRCTGSTAYIYVGERSLLKSVGLRSTWKRPLISGALDGRLAKYELY